MIHVWLAEAASDTSDSGIGGAILLIGAILYFVPTIIGLIRRVRNIGSIVVINIFLGWTLVGWVVALAMSMRTVDRAPKP